MLIIQQRDFESKAGQERIIKTIHHLEVSVHELKRVVAQLSTEDQFLERDLQSPEEQ
jgi:hypothetical protein